MHVGKVCVDGFYDKGAHAPKQHCTESTSGRLPSVTSLVQQEAGRPTLNYLFPQCRVLAAFIR